MDFMMVGRLSFFVVIFLMLSVGSKVSSKEDESPAYTQYADEVTSVFAKEMYRDYGLECGGTGGRMPNDVEKITVSFSIYQNATIEQARELLIKATERFAQIINAHEKIRPFLREYPFPSSRVDVSISFDKPKKKNISSTEENVDFIFQSKKKIFFCAVNPANKCLFDDIRIEPYEEALKIVQENTARKPSPKPMKL